MNTMRRNPEGIAEAIRKAHTVALVSHVNPDGDTIGGVLAMRLILEKLHKEVTLFCDGKVPDSISILPGAELFRVPEGTEGPFDLLLSIDVSDENRMGRSAALKKNSRTTAQIDHHDTNPLFMDINSVDGTAPAVCLLIREQMKALGVPLNRDIATCLYTGLSTDTGNFAYASTTKECFEVMSELMDTGFDLSEMNRILFRVKPRAQIRLLGRALDSLQFRGNGKIAVMTLTQKDFEECGALSEHADTIVNYGLDTIGTEMCMLAREAAEGTVKFSLRAKEPMCVNDIALLFGGGGHPQASGITMAGPLDEAAAKVLAEMEKKMEA